MKTLIGIQASEISGHLFTATGSYYAIATATVDSSGASSITFSSIPQGYTHLQLRYMVKGTTSSGGYPTGSFLTFNSDTGSNYASHDLFGNGSSPSTGATTNTTSIAQAVVTPGLYNNSVGAFGVGVVDILDYTNTNKYKTVRALSGADTNGAGAVLFGSGFWFKSGTGSNVNDAINSLTITADSTYTVNFAQYSSFSLYGVK